MIDVAILGFGTVGSGVVELIDMNKDHIATKLEDQLNVKYILDIRDFPDSPYKDKFVKDFSVIENDPDVKVVAEVIGGATFAYDYTVRALKAGKSVVTSNKELVAQKGFELLELAKENNVNYFFEASVGGGIPLIRPMHRCMAANEITKFFGILNGTTNYILTKMIEENVAFSDALKNAQALGYAEADPTADVEGIDACRKMCILASLAFGTHVYPKDVYAEGITRISLEDVAIADECGYSIKLIGQGENYGEKLKVMVAPALVPHESLLSGVKDVFNSVLLQGNAVGDVFLSGRGAGKLPTASAVVADVLDAAKHFEFLKGWGWQDERMGRVLKQEDLESPWYIRVNNKKEEVLALFPDADIVYDKDAVVGAMVKKDINKTHFEKFEKLNVLSSIRILEL